MSIDDQKTITEGARITLYLPAKVLQSIGDNWLIELDNFRLPSGKKAQLEIGKSQIGVIT